MVSEFTARKHRPLKRILIFIGVVGVPLAIFALLQMRFTSLLAIPIDPTDETRHEFTVKEGMSATQIAKQLDRDGLIRSQLAFRVLVAKHGLESKFMAGRFALRKDQNIEEIVDVLTDPAASEVWVTALEGWRASELAEQIENEGYGTAQDFMECVQQCLFTYDVLSSKPTDQGLEGYLFPDTYIIRLGSPAEEIIEKMVATMDAKFTEAINAGDEAISRLQKNSIHEILTMASVIEREVRTDADRAIVSGILWKRFDADMGLGADATVLYALDDWRAPLTRESLEIDSPYNTRKYRGLPPGPIASPSYKSIVAALYPEDSKYWYYLTTLDTGEVIYAETNDEQNVNKTKYL